MIERGDWVWMPHPAHFICARDCQFSLATKVGKVIVSTVGEYWPERAVREIHAKFNDPAWLSANQERLGDSFDAAYLERFGFEEIGCNRKYETMVFSARRAKRGCCPWRIIVQKNLDFAGYNTAAAAYRGHLRLCEKWAASQ